jgi:tetratricopeptide (TPR) repeat protein
MRSARVTTLVLVGTLLCQVAYAGEPAKGAHSVSKIEQAQTHFAAGATFYRLKNFHAAIREFAAGYALVPRPEFLINLGQAYRQLDDLERARAMYLSYLREAPADAKDRQNVTTLLREVDEELSKREPTTSPPPPESPDLPRQTRDTSTQPPTQPPPDPRNRRMMIGGFTTLGIGLATIIVGGACYAVAKSADDEIRMSTAYNKDLEDRRDHYQIAAFTLLGIGGAATLVGTIVGAVGAHRMRQARHAVTVTPKVSATASGLLVSGTF